MRGGLSRGTTVLLALIVLACITLLLVPTHEIAWPTITITTGNAHGVRSGGVSGREHGSQDPAPLIARRDPSGNSNQRDSVQEGRVAEHPARIGESHQNVITRPPRHRDTGTHWMSIFTVLPDLEYGSSSSDGAGSPNSAGAHANSPHEQPLDHQSALAYLRDNAPNTVMAVMSWLALEMEVILFGSKSTCILINEAFYEFVFAGDVMCRPIQCTERGIPTLDCPFEEARRTCKSPTLAFANGDIVFFPSIKPVIQNIEHVSHRQFFAVGKRTDIGVNVVTQVKAGFLNDLQTCLFSALTKNRKGPLSSESSTYKRCGVMIANHLQNPVSAYGTNHDRNGIDYMIFNRDLSINLPRFLVGRIQWDQWCLLKHIVNPATTTFEISHAVLVVHLGHGQHKESHKKDGTDININLAKKLPHARVHSEDHIDIRGTVWLGRLDEVDFIVYNNDMYESRKKQFLIPTTLKGLDIGGSSVLRIPPEDFKGNALDAGLLKAQPLPLHYVPNGPSLELLFYRAHVILGDRRTVIMVPVPSPAQMVNAVATACYCDAHGFDALFVTTDSTVWHWLTTLGYLVAFVSQQTAVSAWHAAVELGLRAMHITYSFALMDPSLVLSAPLPHIVTESDVYLADIAIAQFSTGAAGQLRTLVLTRASNEAYILWNIVKAQLANEHATTIDKISHRLQREKKANRMNLTLKEASFPATDGGGCGIDGALGSEAYHAIMDGLYMSTRGSQPLDGAAMLALRHDTLKVGGLCSIFADGDSSGNTEASADASSEPTQAIICSRLKQ